MAEDAGWVHSKLSKNIENWATPSRLSTPPDASACLRKFTVKECRVFLQMLQMSLSR